MERIGDASAGGRRLRLSLRGRGWWWVNRLGGGQCPPYLLKHDNKFGRISIMFSMISFSITEFSDGKFLNS